MKKKKNRQDNKVEYGTISLPMPLINSIKKKIKGTGINSVSGYVAFVLRQILSSSPMDSKEILSKKDEAEARTRLKNLGYF